MTLTYLDRGASGTRLDVLSGSVCIANIYKGTLSIVAGQKVFWSWPPSERPSDARPDATLHDIFMNADSGDAAIGTKGIAVPLGGRDGERYVAHVLPLTSGARRKAGTAYSAVAAVFVRKAARDLSTPAGGASQCVRANTRRNARADDDRRSRRRT